MRDTESEHAWKTVITADGWLSFFFSSTQDGLKVKTSITQTFKSKNRHRKTPEESSDLNISTNTSKNICRNIQIAAIFFLSNRMKSLTMHAICWHRMKNVDKRTYFNGCCSTKSIKANAINSHIAACNSTVDSVLLSASKQWRYKFNHLSFTSFIPALVALI